MPEPKEVLLVLDSRRRVTLRIGRHSRYLASEEPDGTINLIPAVVVRATNPVSERPS